MTKLWSSFTATIGMIVFFVGGAFGSSAKLVDDSPANDSYVQALQMGGGAIGLLGIGLVAFGLVSFARRR